MHAGESTLANAAVLLRALQSEYMVWQEEKGEQGRHHLQGFVWWKNPRTFTSVKNQLPAGAHIEKQRGSNSEAAAYCKKKGPDGAVEGGMSYERGEQPPDAGRPQGGMKNSVTALRKAQAHGVKRVLDEDPEVFLKHHTALEKAARMAAMERVPSERDITVYWLYGDAGAGKSRFATRYDTAENTCIVSDTPQGWLDGYSGERTLVIDDFEGQMPYQQVKRMLDRYRYQGPVKGDHVAAEWTTVFVTSNEHPSSYYTRDRWSADPATPSPLQRRITTVFKVTGCYPGDVSWTPSQPPPRPPAAPAAPPAEEEGEEAQSAAERASIDLAQLDLFPQGGNDPEEEGGGGDVWQQRDDLFEDFLNPSDLFHASSQDDILRDLEGQGEAEPAGGRNL